MKSIITPLFIAVTLLGCVSNEFNTRSNLPGSSVRTEAEAGPWDIDMSTEIEEDSVFQDCLRENAGRRNVAQWCNEVYMNAWQPGRNNRPICNPFDYYACRFYHHQ